VDSKVLLKVENVVEVERWRKEFATPPPLQVTQVIYVESDGMVPYVYMSQSGIPCNSSDDEIVANCYRPTHNLHSSLLGNIPMVLVTLQTVFIAFCSTRGRNYMYQDCCM
jgi:hypothetical protein